MAERVVGGCSMNRDDLRLLVNSSVEGGEWAGELPIMGKTTRTSLKSCQSQNVRICEKFFVNHRQRSH